MRRIYTIIYSIILLLYSSCTLQDKNNLEQPIKDILSRYPKATLQDIYKSFFQDYFGVAHMLSSRENVQKYIEYELDNATVFDSILYEPCGRNGNFVRVNLLTIKKGYIDSETLTDAFIKSREASCDSVTQEWLDEWQQILIATKAVAPDLKNFAEDSTAIAHILAEGKYMIHHSKQYNENYHPHYRIIHCDIFRNIILPLLPNE